MAAIGPPKRTSTQDRIKRPGSAIGAPYFGPDAVLRNRIANLAPGDTGGGGSSGVSGLAWIVAPGVRVAVIVGWSSGYRSIGGR